MVYVIALMHKDIFFPSFFFFFVCTSVHTVLKHFLQLIVGLLVVSNYICFIEELKM
jgi:hypothetical protein